MAKYGVVVLLAISSWLHLTAAAIAQVPGLKGPPGLAIVQIQITGDEYIVLQNNNQISLPDLSRYWLHYFNKTDPASPGAKGSIVRLPSSALAPGETVLLSAVGRPTCGSAVSDNLPISLVDGGGFLQLMEQSTGPDGQILNSAADFVSWSSGSSGHIQKVASASPQPVWYRYQKSQSPPVFGWQKAAASATDPCVLQVGGAAADSSNLKRSTVSPPATITSLATTAGLANKGLLAPQISEILPDPKAPQTDAKHEFIEIYNPNGKAFDLSGYQIESGLTAKRRFSFGQGTSLKARGFSVFYSEHTKISLTNSGGQAKLLDPSGAVVSQSGQYDKAQPAISWALADGQWYWTDKPTPGAANNIQQASAANNPTPAGQVKGSSLAANANQAPGSAASKAGPLHPAILAGVGSLALLYGLYEYRYDLANLLEKFRRYRAARRTTGEAVKTQKRHRISLRPRRWQNHIRKRFSQGFRLLRSRFKP